MALKFFMPTLQIGKLRLKKIFKKPLNTVIMFGWVSGCELFITSNCPHLPRVPVV